MRLIVTRPQPQADDWVARFAAAGCDAQALPLLRIEPAGEPAAVAAAWATLARRALAVFVSPNAVAQFFARREAALWPPGTLAAAPGPGSAQALADAGVPPACIVQPSADAAAFDSESLWQVLRALSWAGRDVLLVRGDGGREWLADTLRTAGATVEALQVYRRTPPAPTPAESRLLADALARPDEHLWLLSSSEALGHLQALAPAADWRAARSLASHPRIAEHARAMGFGRVEPSPPDFAAVLAVVCAMGQGLTGP